METSAAAADIARVRASFARQRLMETLGAVLTRVEPGTVEIAMPFRPDLTQQHGFLHAGVVATILDSACGYAAFSLMPPDIAVLTVEYKINLLRPAQGDQLIARARVTRSGQTITVCSGDAFMQTGTAEKAVATMLATVMAVPQREGLRQYEQCLTAIVFTPGTRSDSLFVWHQRRNCRIDFERQRCQ